MNGGVGFLVVFLFGIPPVIRNAEHLVLSGSEVFYLNFFLKNMRKIYQ